MVLYHSLWGKVRNYKNQFLLVRCVYLKHCDQFLSDSIQARKSKSGHWKFSVAKHGWMFGIHTRTPNVENLIPMLKFWYRWNSPFLTEKKKRCGERFKNLSIFNHYTFSSEDHSSLRQQSSHEPKNPFSTSEFSRAQSFFGWEIEESWCVFWEFGISEVGILRFQYFKGNTPTKDIRNWYLLHLRWKQILRSYHQALSRILPFSSRNLERASNFELNRTQ